MKFLTLANCQAFLLPLFAHAMVLAYFSATANPVIGQTITDKIQQHLDYGEFPNALRLAQSIEGEQRDRAMERIASAQMKQGAIPAAYESIGQIKEDSIRFRFLANQYGSFFGQSETGDNGQQDQQGFGGGQAGGITEADFEPLIDLIKTTIDPEGWDDTNGDGTIQVFPSGVYVDSEGALQRLRIDKKRQLKLLRKNVDDQTLNREVTTRSSLRKVSLTRLENQAQILAAQGKPLDSAMRNLAGIYDIQYLAWVPETGDILIAGPAGPWRADDIGRNVNAETGLPTLQLDDLVVCLRNAWDNQGKYGCKITPRQRALVATQEFLATSELKGKAWREQLRETLGFQDIEVFGIDPHTHAGCVLVEADYRMKLVGMGLEPSIPEVPSYLQRLLIPPGSQAIPLDVVRWWFTLDYDDVVTDEAREIFTFNGTGVKVLSENELLDKMGNRIHTGKSKGPTAGFANDFTQHFTKLSARYPIYRELKNLFDLSIVAALIKNQKLAERANWNMTFFGNAESSGNFVYQPRTRPIASEVASVMNHRILSERKQQSTLKHTLVGLSGGISFDAMQLVKPSRTKTDKSGELSSLKLAPNRPEEPSIWWWD